MPTKNKHVTSPYYSIAQLRLARWNNLKLECNELSHSKKGSASEKSHSEQVKTILNHLKCIECYFVFPGKIKIEKLLQCLDRSEYTSLTHQVAEITRQLVSDDYLLNNNSNTPDEPEQARPEELRELSSGQKKNYFEVLFVENLSTIEENALHEKLKELREPNEPFTYDFIVQPSFQDAMIALMFNPNIQAVVIRYAPPFVSSNITELITPYIQHVLNIDLKSRSESELGPLLGEYVKQFRPELDTYYVTDTSLTDLKNSTLQQFSRIYYRREDLQELHLGIIRGIRERFDTPFFTAVSYTYLRAHETQ